MNFEIIFPPKVRDEMHEMKQDHGMERYLKDIHKALEYPAHDPKHPGLHTHKNGDLEGANGEEVFDRGSCKIKIHEIHRYALPMIACQG